MSSESTMTDNDRETDINVNETPHGLSAVQERALRNTLLELEEIELESDLRSKFFDATEAGQSAIKANKSNPKKCSVPRSVPEFSGWCSSPLPKPKRADPTKVKSSRDREVPRWESLLTKDYRPREIHFVFKHHDDWKKYIEQYRKEHTYNYGPIGGMDVQIEIPRTDPIQKSPLHTIPIREGNLSASSSKKEARTRSESSILELARRYKFGASTLRTLQGSSIVDVLSKHSAPDSTTKSETDSVDLDSSSICNPSTEPRNLSSVVKSATETLTRLSDLPTDKSSLALRGNVLKRVPVRLSPEITESSLYGANGKLLKRSSINGHSNDNQGLMRITNNKSPNQVFPKHSLRTVDLLSHVSNVDKQVWFDASGRAYVSLATRYEPVRK